MRCKTIFFIPIKFCMWSIDLSLTQMSQTNIGDSATVWANSFKRRHGGLIHKPKLSIAFPVLFPREESRFVNAQLNVLQRQKEHLQMSVWKTEKHDVAFSIYKSFDVRSHPDKQKGLVFFYNRSRLLREVCIISTSVNNMTVLQSYKICHETGLSI